MDSKPEKIHKTRGRKDSHFAFFSMVLEETWNRARNKRAAQAIFNWIRSRARFSSSSPSALSSAVPTLVHYLSFPLFLEHTFRANPLTSIIHPFNLVKLANPSKINFLRHQRHIDQLLGLNFGPISFPEKFYKKNPPSKDFHSPDAWK